MQSNESQETSVETREINVVLSAVAYRELEELADRRGMTTVGDVVLSGIAWESFVDEVLTRSW